MNVNNFAIMHFVVFLLVVATVLATSFPEVEMRRPWKRGCSSCNELFSIVLCLFVCLFV